MLLLLALGACVWTEPTPAALPRPTLWTPARASASWVPAPTRDLRAEAAGLAPDGTRVYAGSRGTLRAVDTGTGATVASWTLGHVRPARDVGVSPDGARVAVVSEGGEVARVEVGTGTIVPLHIEDPPREGLHGENRLDPREVTVANDGAVRVRAADGWHGGDAAAGSVAPNLAPAAGGHGVLAVDDGAAAWVAADLWRPETVERSSDGRWLVARVRDGDETRVLLRGPLPSDMPTIGPPVTAERGEGAGRTTGVLALHPAGRRLAAGHGDAVAVWDLATGEPRWLDLPEAHTAMAVAWSPAGDRLAVLSGGTRRDRLRSVLHVYEADVAGVPTGPPRSVSVPVQAGARVALAVHASAGVFVAGGSASGRLLHVAPDGSSRAVDGGVDDGFAPSVVVSPAGVWFAWRAGEGALRVRRTADPEAALRTVRIQADDRAVLLGASSTRVTARSAEEAVTFDLETAEAARDPLAGRPHPDQIALFGARAAADGLGVALRDLDWRALDLDLGYAGTQAEALTASADGTFAWADDDGRVWVETDDGAGPRLLTGPALTPASVSFVGAAAQIWRAYARAVTTFPLDGGSPTVSTEEEARAAGGATGPKWASIPGEMSWLGSTPDGTVGVYADAAGIVYLHRAGETDPFRALLTWPEGLP